VDRNCIRAWRDKEAQLAALNPGARRLPGAGRRPTQSLPVSTGDDASAATSGSSTNTEEGGLEPATRGSKRQKTGSTGPISGPAPPLAPTSSLPVELVAGVAVDDGVAHLDLNGLAAAGPPLVVAPVVPSVAAVPAPVTTDFLLIGFQGKEGAFSDVAARRAFEELQCARALTPPDFETVGYTQVAHVLSAVERGEVKYGVVPVENSISGTFHGNLDRLVASHLKIVGEIACMQELCLIALPEAKREDIDCLLSHPAVLNHCEEFVCDLERKNGAIIERQATWDSAGACQMVRQENARTVAAIASEQAARAHGLAVLERGVGDELNNETRYMILARLDALPLPLGMPQSHSRQLKASVVIAVPNEPQALFKIVSAFALRNVMIVKIESRPAATAGSLFASQTHHWDYIFYIDYIAHSDAAVNASLRRNLDEFALWVKDLGTYASTTATKTNVEPPRWKSVCSAIAC
jgi:arogenate/prephenate dehydratase